MNRIYKEYYEVNTDEEQNKKWKELRSKGYSIFDIYCGNYKGNDGKFHRTVFVFA